MNSIDYLLRNITKKNIKEAIIFPYGKYGELLDKLLSYKNIKVKYRVDNYKCDLDGIISGNELRKVYNGEEIILSTSLAKSIQEIKMELKSYVEDEKINCIFPETEYVYVNEENLYIDKILPKPEDNKKTYKVFIMDPLYTNKGFSVGIYKWLNNNANIDFRIIISKQVYTEKWYKELIKQGFCACLEDEISFEKEKLDMVILTNYYDHTYWKGLREHTKYVIAIPFSLIPYVSIEDTMAKMCFWEMEYSPDYYIYDSLLYHTVKSIGAYSRNSENIVEMGNPKYDEIYNELNSEIKSKFSKFDGRDDCKTIFWGTTHGLIGKTNDSEICVEKNCVAFPFYANAFFEYARTHKNMNFIIRLHHDFIKELKEFVWSDVDEKSFFDYIDETSNIVYDTNPTYKESYSIADAIITDRMCGIIMSALPTGKPICITYNCEDMDSEDYINECCYKVNTEKDFISFLDMIASGKDNMREKREEAIIKYVKNFDGNNSKRIVDFIYSILENGKK